MRPSCRFGIAIAICDAKQRHIAFQHPKPLVEESDMKRMKKDNGQSLVEYALIIALVAVVLVAGLQALEGGITGTFNGIVGSL